MAAFLFKRNRPTTVHKMIKVEQLIVFKKDVEMVDFDCMRVIALEPLCQSTKRSLTDKSDGTWIGHMFVLQKDRKAK